jgi:hypothetical protein
MQAIIQAGQEWMTRFGIDFEKDREADVKLEVARRKQVVFVAVYNRCLPDPYNLQTDNPTDTSKEFKPQWPSSIGAWSVRKSSNSHGATF